jgi:hypothetical protein
MNIAELKDLYEKVREYDEIISIPNTVRYSELNSHQSTLSNIISSIDQFNADAKDQKDQRIQLKRIYQQSMHLIAELIDENLKMKYDHRLEIKKKEYVVAKLKQYIDDKEDLDAEIPSDDDKEEKSDDKTKGLSKKEMEIIKSLKN